MLQQVGSIEKIQTGYTELDYGKRPHIMVTVKRNPSYVAPPKKTKVKEPETPERLKSDKLEKKMKKVLKEGGHLTYSAPHAKSAVQNICFLRAHLL